MFFLNCLTSCVFWSWFVTLALIFVSFLFFFFRAAFNFCVCSARWFRSGAPWTQKFRNHQSYPLPFSPPMWIQNYQWYPLTLWCEYRTIKGTPYPSDVNKNCQRYPLPPWCEYRTIKGTPLLWIQNYRRYPSAVNTELLKVPPVPNTELSKVPLCCEYRTIKGTPLLYIQNYQCTPLLWIQNYQWYPSAVKTLWIHHIINYQWCLMWIQKGTNGEL